MVAINKHDNYHQLAILTGHLGLSLIQKRDTRSARARKLFLLLEGNNEVEAGEIAFSAHIFFCKLFMFPF